MKLKTIGSILGFLLALPALAVAGTVSSTIVLSGSFTTNTDSQFTANLNNFQVLSGAVGILSISDSSTNDIKSASFLDKSGWVKLTPYQNGSDVLAKFTSNTGFDMNGQRIVNFRVNFKSPRTYVVGFTLQTADGKTLTSSASPLTVTGAKVLGAETDAVVSGATMSGYVGRTLKYGSTGADVTVLQNKLASEGLFSSTTSMFFGRLTQAAVKAYQAKHGISPANGVVGPQTLATLNQ